LAAVKGLADGRTWRDGRTDAAADAEERVCCVQGCSTWITPDRRRRPLTRHSAALAASPPNATSCLLLQLVPTPRPLLCLRTLPPARRPLPGLGARPPRTAPPVSSPASAPKVGIALAADSRANLSTIVVASVCHCILECFQILLHGSYTCRGFGGFFCPPPPYEIPDTCTIFDKNQLSLTNRATHFCKYNDMDNLTSDPPVKIWFLASGLSRSLKVVGTDTNRPAIYYFLLVFYSNFVPKTLFSRYSTSKIL